MQCVNCGFENIPGMKACVRCQSNLSLGEVSVAPPRASGYHLGTSLRQWWNVVRTAVKHLPNILPRWKRNTVEEYTVRWEAVFASFIPGLGQIRYGRKLTGYLLLTAWIGLMIGALVTLGLDDSQWYLSAAVAVHAIAVMAFLGPMFTDSNLLIRTFFGTLVFACIRLGLYYPAGLLGERFYVPFPVTGITSGPVVQNDDVLLCRGPWLKPQAIQRGDLVIYKFPDPPAGLGHFRFAEGYGLDRVVGVPGDHVQVVADSLLVNGKPVPPELSPIGSFNNLDGLDIVCHDEYAILPTRIPYTMHGIRNPQQIIGAMSKIPRSNIAGIIAYRIQPWSRFGKVR